MREETLLKKIEPLNFSPFIKSLQISFILVMLLSKKRIWQTESKSGKKMKENIIKIGAMSNFPYAVEQNFCITFC